MAAFGFSPDLSTRWAMRRMVSELFFRIVSSNQCWKDMGKLFSKGELVHVVARIATFVKSNWGIRLRGWVQINRSKT